MKENQRLSRRAFYIGAGALSLSSSLAIGRQPARDLLSFIPSNLHGGVSDGTNRTPLTKFIQDAFDSGEEIKAPTGVFLLDGPVQIKTLTLKGAGRGKTVFRLPDKNLNAFRLSAPNAHIAHLTIDLVNSDQKANGSCLLLVDTTNCTIFDIEALNANRQGFTANRATGNNLIGLYARRCGHRGLNFSRGSSGNTIRNFRADECGFSGMLFGFQSGGNKVEDVRIRRTEISPGLVLMAGSNGNAISNVSISDPARDTEPHVQIGAACCDNRLSDFSLDGVNNRGILVRNERFYEPYPDKLGIQNGPITGNVLERFKLRGAGNPKSVGLIFEDKDGLGIARDRFLSFNISGVSTGIEDRNGAARDIDFENITFGSDVRRRWQVPEGRGHRLFNVNRHG